MPRRHIQFERGRHYHITNLGLAKKKIFYDSNDYEWFLNHMQTYKKKYNIDISCYCLMPNHFHLIASQTGDIGLLKFICTLEFPYAKHFNSRWNRKGQLFGKRYFSKLIEDQEQLINTIQYIINNPVRAGLVASPEEWPYLSFNLPKISQTKLDNFPRGKFNRLEFTD